MADEEKEKYKTYNEDKAQYNTQCYNEWSRWFDEFRSRIKENNDLFSNFSQDLAKRKKDPTLSRACGFIPVIGPSALSRAAYMTNLGLNSVEQFIEVEAKGDTPPQNAENVKLTVHDYLDKDDFRLKWLKAKIAQEIFPISFLQICETEDEETVLKIQPETSREYPQAEVKLGDFKKWTKEKTGWRPTVILRTQQAVFYDPLPAEWSQKRFIGTVTPLTLAELEERKATMGYRFSRTELEKDGEKWKEDEFLSELDTSSKGESKLSIGKQTRYKVIENWHTVVESEEVEPEPQEESQKAQGEKEESPDSKREIKILRKITTTCGKVVLRDDDFPYESLDITDLFVPLIGYPVLNRVEGNCTADFLKHLQHMINDFFNITIDAGKYGLFPPELIDSRAIITSKMKIGPSSRWVVNVDNMPPGSTVKDALTSLFNITPLSKEFFALIDALLERTEIVSGTPHDFLMGGETDPSEKATKTTMRAKGASGRLAGINLLMDVEAFKQMARVMWIMTLERLPTDKKYHVGQVEMGLNEINGRMRFDVPHLSGMAQREIKLVKLRELLVMLNEFGLLQVPAMMPVLYTILKKISELSLLPEFDEIFPREVMQEVQAAMQQQIQGQAGPGASMPGAGGEEERIPPVVEAAIAEQLG